MAIIHCVTLQMFFSSFMNCLSTNFYLTLLLWLHFSTLEVPYTMLNCIHFTQQINPILLPRNIQWNNYQYWIKWLQWYKNLTDYRYKNYKSWFACMTVADVARPLFRGHKRLHACINCLPLKPLSPLLLPSQHWYSFNCFQASSKSVVHIPPFKDNNVMIR